MHACILAVSMTLAAITAMPAQAQTYDAVFEALQTIYGVDAAGNFDAAFEALTTAMAEGDLNTIASLGSYPFEIAANGELYDIFEPTDFTANFEALLLPETVEAVAAQDYADLIVTDEGVGFAAGALWMALVCTDASCASGDWLITRINN
jgi:hypothetical protein